MPRGGARPNSGRPKGSKDKSTAAQKATLSELARKHTEDALAALVSVMNSPKSGDSARVAAANSILDRGYGKPIQAVEHAGKDGEKIPFTGFMIDRAKSDPADAD